MFISLGLCDSLGDNYRFGIKYYRILDSNDGVVEIYSGKDLSKIIRDNKLHIVFLNDCKYSKDLSYNEFVSSYSSSFYDIASNLVGDCLVLYKIKNGIFYFSYDGKYIYQFTKKDLYYIGMYKNFKVLVVRSNYKDYISNLVSSIYGIILDKINNLGVTYNIRFPEIDNISLKISSSFALCSLYFLDYYSAKSIYKLIVNEFKLSRNDVTLNSDLFSIDLFYNSDFIRDKVYHECFIVDILKNDFSHIVLNSDDLISCNFSLSKNLFYRLVFNMSISENGYFLFDNLMYDQVFKKYPYVYISIYNYISMIRYSNDFSVSKEISIIDSMNNVRIKVYGENVDTKYTFNEDMYIIYESNKFSFMPKYVIDNLVNSKDFKIYKSSTFGSLISKCLDEIKFLQDDLLNSDFMKKLAVQKKLLNLNNNIDKVEVYCKDFIRLNSFGYVFSYILAEVKVYNEKLLDYIETLISKFDYLCIDRSDFYNYQRVYIKLDSNKLNCSSVVFSN